MPRIFSAQKSRGFACPIAQLPQLGTRRCTLRWLPAWGFECVCLTQPRPLLSRSFGRAGASEVMFPHAQAAQRHTRQEAAGAIGQAPTWLGASTGR